MFKKLFLTSLLIFISTITIYPIKRENLKLYDYCFSFEKILLRNTISKRENYSSNLNSISGKITKFGVNKTRGEIIKKVLDQYKNSKNNFLFNLIPNDLICLSGYWIEKLNPGTFESILYEKSEKKLYELKKFKKDVDHSINKINSEYEIIKRNFEGFF